MVCTPEKGLHLVNSVNTVLQNEKAFLDMFNGKFSILKEYGDSTMSLFGPN